MANTTLFQSAATMVRPHNTTNAAGGRAYTLEAKEALAKFAVTNTFGGTFYASGAEQLDQLKALVDQVDDNDFLAKLAVYARKQAHMKDMPAYLLAVLANRDTVLLQRVFGEVVDNAKMLKNFVQILRSGVTGRKSLGTAPKRLVRAWLRNRTGHQLVNDNVGGEPSLRDVLRMVHPRPRDPAQNALFGYVLGHPVDESLLPVSLQALKAFHRGETTEVPNVAFQLLTGQTLSSAQWTTIARQAPWQMTRMNLNTFLRHGVFSSTELVKLVADRLRDPAAVKAARVMPYQLMAAYLNIDPSMPKDIVSALHDAMEMACENVPCFAGKKVVVAVDVSGSMRNPVTGDRGTATTKVRCVDVAALMASALLRANPDADVVCFEEHVVSCRLEPRDTVLTNARLLAGLSGGGTNCAAAMAHIAKHHADADVVIFVSDNESWMEYAGNPGNPWRARVRAGELSMASLWRQFHRKNPASKLVLIDVTPTLDAQNYTQDAVMNIGGFSDAVFATLAGFVTQDASGVDFWVNQIMPAE